MSTQTRRDRRAARFAGIRSGHPSRAVSTPEGRSRSPIAWLSIVGLVFGTAIVASLIISGQGARPGGDTSGIQPAIAMPAAFVQGRSMGDPDAPVQIEVWSDFQCPACGMFTRTIEPLLRSTYIEDGTVQLRYRDLAFLGNESVDAAVAARVADDIGPGFWRFHDILFANQAGGEWGGFSRERLGAMAESLGMDRATFLDRLDDPALRAAVREETASGTAAGIDSTPTLVIDGVAYAGSPAWERLAQLIDRLVASS